MFLDFLKKKKYNNPGPTYEYCPRCQANLTMQKGYRNDVPYWICRGCGEMLINPEIDGDITWICDGCGVMLNIQEGFSDKAGSWKCEICGFENKIDADEVYVSEEEYQASLLDPYKGLSDEEVLAVMSYSQIDILSEKKSIVLVEDADTGEKFVRKFLVDYDLDVYRFIRENPVKHMPYIKALYKGDNGLWVIEEYIEGKRLADILKENTLSSNQAVTIARDVMLILRELHTMDTPIIHRDISPNNIIIGDDNTVYLLDIDIAKVYKADETEDTRLMGTPNYAAPEQAGFGYKASSAKADIYSVGVLLNVMITGKKPKDELAPAEVGKIVLRCSKLEADDRFDDEGLIEALESIVR